MVGEESTREEVGGVFPFLMSMEGRRQKVKRGQNRPTDGHQQKVLLKKKKDTKKERKKTRGVAERKN